MKITSKRVPESYDDWTLYEWHETGSRGVVIYYHEKLDVWAILEEQRERMNELTHFATAFIQEDNMEREHTVLLETRKLMRVINLSLKWNLQKLRAIEGDVGVAYAFADVP